jgi:hypothetical protein
MVGGLAIVCGPRGRGNQGSEQLTVSGRGLEEGPQIFLVDQGFTW